MRLAAAGALCAVVACAPTPAPVAAPPADVQEFVFPAPMGGEPSNVASQQNRAWQDLTAGRIVAAEQLFARLLKANPRYAPAETGLGYVALARRDFKTATPRFERVLTLARTYEPALVGRALALLGSGRDEAALQAFRDVIAVNPANAQAVRRAQLVALRLVDREVDAARAAAAANDRKAAESRYRRAMTFAPDTAALYRELGLIELQEHEEAAAQADLETAARLDPADIRVAQALGDLRMARGDFVAAATFYDRALAQDPDNAELRERAEHARAQAELAAQPEELQRIPTADKITRGDLAALLATRLPALVNERPKPRRAVVITDARGEWARAAIRAVVHAGLMEVYPNHTFQPKRLVRRGDLAMAVANSLQAIALRAPALSAEWEGQRRKIPDVGPGSLYFRAVSTALAAGILPLLPDGTFQVSRLVSGAEAAAAVDALATLSRRAIAP